MRAALALPILAIPARAGAAEVGEMGVSVLGYKERRLMKVTEPVLWARLAVDETWELRASAAVDIVSGASPQVVSNESGRPVQTISGASVDDRRRTWDARVSRRFGEVTLAASRAVSKEEDYRSHAYGLEATLDLDKRNTTLAAAYGQSNDRIGSTDEPALDERRDVREYLVGLTQVLSPVAVVQSTLQASRGKGWFNDPYKFTITFYPDGELPAFMPDRRPGLRSTFAWLTRYRRHWPAADASLHLDYRFFRDDWGIRSHTAELGWQQSLGPRLTIRPALRYYTQSAADFYAPEIPRPAPEIHSSDQRLAAFGGLSPSVRAQLRLANGLAIEAMLGHTWNSRRLRPGGGSESFETLRAWWGLVGMSREF